MEQIVLPLEVVLSLMEEAFRHGGFYDLTVTGASMSPTLKPGRDAVRLVPPTVKPPKKGDIILARRKMGGVMLHRVEAISPDGMWTLNGDGQEWSEEVREADILAVVSELCRKGKWISVEAPLYMVYVRLWRLTKPFRNQLVDLKKRVTGGKG